MSTDMFSVIMPALNEASYIEQTLEAIPSDVDPVELIVVDGGSTDRTRELAASYARVIQSERGRAVQMNAGAAEASGSVLVFLHADTRLPEGAFSIIRSVLDEGAVESGAFRLAFDSWTPLLRFYSFCTRFRVPQICFGDRVLFVRRSVFEEVGGFPEIPVFEDLEMVRLLHRRGGFRFLTQHVNTSARRFLQRGPFRQQLLNTYMWCQFMLGVDPRKIAPLYEYGTTSDVHDPSTA
ncbi:MAG TPA: TIGR04283 family arsenosugar biosynthesis glycosyltransferase [Rhodothermales bacterium]|nr:TIGR04283 family arsenosugar biosynthesis glycosyltransferase [Rhodothermales bacterium]